MKMIQKSLGFLLLLAMICVLSACTSKSQPNKQTQNNSIRTDSQTNSPTSSEMPESSDSSETIQTNATPHVPEAMYQSEIESGRNYWMNWISSYTLPYYGFNYNVYYTPDESTHREDVCIVYEMNSDYGTKKFSKTYTYQYHASDDIWELIYRPNQYELEEYSLNWENFQRHWYKKCDSFVYSIDVSEVDTATQTFTISYVIKDTRYGTEYHKEGTRTIGYSLSGNSYCAEFEDGYTYTIYLDIYGLICYNV